MTCQNCGFQCDNQATSCPKCGSPVNAGQNGYYQQYNQQAPNGQYQNQQYGSNQQYGGYNQQANNGYNNQQFNNYRVPIKQKNIALCIVLTICTCGIYGIIWFINLVDDLNLASGSANATSGGVVFLLTLVTCGIYGIYWFYKAGEKVSFMHQRQGLAPDTSTAIIYLLLSLFGFSIVCYALIQSELNKVAMQ